MRANLFWLSDEQWSRIEPLRTPGFRQYWEISRDLGNFSDEYAQFVDDLIARTPISAHSTTFDLWKSRVAAMKANSLKQ